MLPSSSSFHLAMAGLQTGQQQAARQIYERFVDQLIRLDAKRLNRKLGAQADPESVALSVFESFFERQAKGEFALHNWGMVLGLLSHIAIRKCLNRNRALTTQKRGAGAAIPFEDWQKAAAGPTPEDEIMVADLLTHALSRFEDEEREMIDAYMQGATTEAVATQTGFSKRTIERVLERFRTLLRELLGNE